MFEQYYVCAWLIVLVFAVRYLSCYTLPAFDGEKYFGIG